VLLNTTAGIKRPSLSARSRAVRISSFGWRDKLSAATQTRLSTIIIEELISRRSLSLHFFKSLVVLVLKIVAIEIVFLAFLVLPVLLTLLVLLVLFAVLAELIVLNLPLFVSILVLVSKLTLFRCILLELIARRNEALRLLRRFSFSSFLIIVETGGSLR
jgi:pilus assembly protein TadC